MTAIKALVRRYGAVAKRPDIMASIALSTLLFAGSIIVSFFAIQYATLTASNAVTDLILSNIPIFDVDGLFVYGTVLLIIFATLVVLYDPKRIPFVLFSLTLFFLIRSAFTSLTHIGPFHIPPPNADWGTLSRDFLFSSDLFFSAHTGVPFLLALIYWRDALLRNLFLLWSVYMGIVVLLGHYHYSIDVASAYFITYTIFCLCEFFFPESRKIFYGA